MLDRQRSPGADQIRAPLRASRALTFADRLAGIAGRTCFWETALGLFNGRDRRRVAVVVTSDGRRVQIPVEGTGLVDVSLLGLLRALGLGLAGLLGLITDLTDSPRGAAEYQPHPIELHRSQPEPPTNEPPGPNSTLKGRTS